MPDDIGSYQVFHGGNAIRFWPLVAGTTLAQAAPPAAAHPVQPGQPNVIVVANFGLVDIALPLPLEAPITRANVANTGLTARVAGNGVDRAEVFANQNGNANMAQLSFAVDCGHAVNPYDAELRVTIETRNGARRHDILLQVRPGAEENSLFMALALVQPQHPYTWLRMRAVSQANAATNINNGGGTLRILRDNRIAVRGFNRELLISTDNAGLIRLGGLLPGTQDRTTVGVPLDLPFVCDMTAAGFERRVHMLELGNAQRAGRHNNNPNTPGNLTMIPTASASLAAHTFLLDPGHAVIYDHTKGIRVYEWFLSHRTAHHIFDLLTSRHGVPEANIRWMRTAGLALIDPHQFVLANPTGPTPNTVANWPQSGAVVHGEARFSYDMATRRLHTLLPAVTLTDVSDLLLTTHQTIPPFARLPVPDGARQRILDENPVVLGACIRRVVAGLRGRAFVELSQRWDPATQRYVFDTRPTADPAGAIQTHNIAIRPADLWVVNDISLRTIAERTARWSIMNEGLNASAFSTRIRNAMLNHGALSYMANACFEEADVPPGHPFIAHTIKGWGFNERRTMMSRMNPAPEIALTLHHNGMTPPQTDAVGFMLLACDPATANEAHVRLQKTFVKYVTGLGAGLASGGITQANPNAMNGAQYRRIAPGYAFFEVEFMDAPSGATPTPYEYERLVEDAFLRRLAEEIVAGVVEFLVHPQPNAELDPIAIGNGIREGAVHW